MPSVAPYLIVLVAIVFIIARSGRAQNVQPGRLWVLPALGILILLANLSRRPVPGIETLAVFASALAAGIGIGWFRALHTEVSLDPATGQVVSRNTMLGTILLIGFIALRIVVDKLTQAPQPADGMQGLHRLGAAHPALLLDLADAGLVFSIAMMATRRVIVWRRASALLAAHRPTVAPPPA